MLLEDEEHEARNVGGHGVETLKDATSRLLAARETRQVGDGRAITVATFGVNDVAAFIEALTFAEADEIVAVLDAALAADFLGLPPWARNVAFRLACLLRPDDADLLRWAANDLKCFGPDWDMEADRLLKEADEIERRSH